MSSRRKIIMKRCGKCNKEIRSTNYARHKRICKGKIIINGRCQCDYCGKEFRSDHLNRHLRSCKAKKDKVIILQKELIKSNTKLISALTKLNKQEKELAKKPIINNITNNIVNFNFIIGKMTAIDLSPNSDFQKMIRKLFREIILETKGKIGIGEPKLSFMTEPPPSNKAAQIAANLEKGYRDYCLDPEDPKLICTDPARQKFVYKNKAGRPELDLGFEKGLSCYKGALIDTMHSLEFADNPAISHDESRTLGQIVDEDDKLERFTKKMTSEANNFYKNLLEKEKEKIAQSSSNGTMIID